MVVKLLQIVVVEHFRLEFPPEKISNTVEE